MKIIMSVSVDAVKVISARNSFIVLRRATSMPNAHSLDAAHLDIAALRMFVMEGKLMEIFASKIQNASITSVILVPIIQNLRTQQ